MFTTSWGRVLRGTPVAVVGSYCRADAVDNEFDMPAWLWACDHGRKSCLQPLIDAGCDTQATDKDGKTGREVAQSNNPPHQSVLAFIAGLSMDQ